MVDWTVIGSRAWRGALFAAVIGLIATPLIAIALLLLGKPIFAELALMVFEGVILGAVANGAKEYFKQKGWPT